MMSEHHLDPGNVSDALFAVSATGFGLTLADLDHAISIAAGIVALGAGILAIYIRLHEIKKAKKKR